MEIQQKYFPSFNILPHYFCTVKIYLIFYSSFQTLLLPLNLPFPSVETGFNPLAFCDASRLQSEDFISEITPNLLPHWQALQKYCWRGRYHSSLPFHCNQCEILYDNVPHVSACGLLVYPAFGLSYFQLILLFIIALQIIYQLIWSNCTYKSIPHASWSASGTPSMALVCSLCTKYALWRTESRGSIHSGQPRGLWSKMSGIQIQASPCFIILNKLCNYRTLVSLSVKWS